MNYIELPKEACFTPIYSPRTSLSRINAELDRLTTNLAINIDKYILGFFKDAFEENNNQLTRNEFISQGLKHLKSWQRELKFREKKIHYCLSRLYSEADSNNNGKITWNEFNSMLIEKGLNLKSLRNQEPGNTALMKPVPLTGPLGKHGPPIQKLLNVGGKIALFTEQSSEIRFFNLDGSVSSLKTLVLSQQALTVQTSISKRNKVGKKQLIKKDMVVAEYKNVILDMIYIDDGKYNMLITSSTDYIVRGWDISSNLPLLAKQPENQDEKMQHQFVQQIHTMAWDNVNQILYCCGKSPVIREWMVKTDSERDLYDPEGHTQMISAMIMMPKLQFLATGGYDGKLILWDTISQTKKFKYKEHTRSISCMTFHQGLILLFTAAYDHSICVWNPYIQSLVHKIISNVNFIQLDIIPDSNLLIALDADSNVKIREINKFSLVSSFSIDKHQHKIEPTCLISTTNPLKYYFAGTAVCSYDYIHIDANVIQDATALCLKYHPSSFTLYCPIKNHLVGWDLLTGSIALTLRNLTPAEIAAFDMFTTTKIGVFGDCQGNLVLRKLQNGVLVKKLYKHKLNVTNVLIEQYNREKMVFSASYDGEIAIFQRDLHGDFNHLRSLSIKKVNPQTTVTALCYEHHRNTLIIGSNIGDVFFMDVDKNKIITKCETRGGDIEQFVHFSEESILLCFSKRAEIFGLYLPPHIKKFKPSCHLVSDQTSAKINTVAMSLKNNRCYLGFDNGDLMCFMLGQDVLSCSSEEIEDKQRIRHVWRNNFGDSIKNIYLIESQDTLAIIVGVNDILLIACESGEQIAELNEKYQQNQAVPILFLDDQKNSIFIKSLDISVPIQTKSKEEHVRHFFDPTFYLGLVKAYHQKINITSNSSWKFYPKIQHEAYQTVKDIVQLIHTIQQYERQPKKLHLVKASSQTAFDLTKAAELQKRWERHREEEDALRTTKQHSLNSYHNASSNGLRMSKYSTYNRSSQRVAWHKQQQKEKEISSPLYKLGAALRSLNQKDNKALKLMEMAQQQHRSRGAVKLPKI